MASGEQTDRQTDKTSRWAFTAYEGQWDLFSNMPELVNQWGWQTETCPTTGKKHYQGFVQMKRQVRASQMRTIFPGVHVEAARDWNKLLNYCKKTDTAVEGTQVLQTNPQTHLSMSDALMKLAAHVPFRAPPTEEEYTADNWTKKWKEIVEDEYIQATSEILTEDRRLVGVYATNTMKQAWSMYRKVFIEHVIKNVQKQCDEQAVEEPALDLISGPT